MHQLHVLATLLGYHQVVLAYRVTALHTGVSNGGGDLVYSGQIHEFN